MKRLSILSALLPALFAPSLLTPHMAERGEASGTSKIEKELVEGADIADQKRGESRQDFLARVKAGVQGMTDKTWDKLSDEAQEWYNANVEATNANKKNPDPKFELADFPDIAAAEEEKPRGRRSAEADEPQTASADNLKKGQRVKITNKRGKVFEGEVTDLDKETVVVGEDEIALDRIDTIEIFHGTSGAAEEPEDPISVGKEVELTTKRGKKVAGKIVELTDELIVLDIDGEDTEFMRDRVDAITPKGGSKKDDDAGTRRSSTRGEDKGSDKGADKKDEKAPRASNAPGVSIGQRIKDIMADDLEIDEAGIAKILKKEGIDYKDATLRLNFLENGKMIAALKAAKKLK